MIDISERPLFVVDSYSEIPEGVIPVRRVKRSDEFRYPLAEKVLNFLRSYADIYFPFVLSPVPAVDFLVVSEKGSLGNRDLALDLTLMSEDEFEECLTKIGKPKSVRSDSPMDDFFRDYEEFLKTV